MTPWQAMFEAARFGLEVQSVIALRMIRIAAGGPLAMREAQRMVVEKGAAFVNAQMAAAVALGTGAGPQQAADRALATYRRSVRANQRRLSRR